MTVESIDFSRFKFCECGYCKEIISIKDKRGRPRRFKNHHHANGKNNPKWKNGISYNGDGYRLILKKVHFSRLKKCGRIAEHRLIYEEYYQCCLLSYTDIDHINNNKLDNRIENLRPLYRSEHTRNHKKK